MRHRLCSTTLSRPKTLGPSPAAPPLFEPSPTLNVDPPQLLVLDDHADTRLLITYLCPSSWHLTLCATCAEAQSALTTQRFDLLILDIQLPDGSGRDVLRFARRHRNSRNNDVPAVAVTAMAYTSAKTQRLKEEFETYLTKPFRKSDFVEIVCKHELIQP